MLGINGLVRLVEAATVKEFGERKVINMRVICSNRVKRGENWVDEPVSIDAHYWVHKNSTLDNFLKKGQQVYVNGHLAQETWEKEGKNFYKLVAELSTVELAGSKEDNAGTSGASNTAAKKETKEPAPQEPSGGGAANEDDDEIPF